MYHRVKVRNQNTGEEEVIAYRISRAGFLQWLAHRDMLRDAGRPDRPPDVDTETAQIWLVHPGEETHPDFARKLGRKDIHQRGDVVYVAVWPSASLSVYIREGGYDVLLYSNNPYVTKMAAGVPEEGAWDEIEPLLAAVNETRQADGSPLWANPPMVTTCRDLELVDLEVQLAMADIQRGFPSPLPEPRLLQ
jgi:hypothetical protein